MERSPFELAKDIQGLVQTRLSGVDVDSFPPTQRELLRRLKRQLGEVRLDVRDYGLAETKADQLHRGKTASKRLQQLQQLLLEASEYGVFGAADMAIISAHIEQLMAELKE